MSPNKVLWSVVCGTISGIIAAWLVFKFLEKKGSGPKGAREEIRELRDEQYDRDNPADKLPEENDERLDKRAEEHAGNALLRSVFKFLFWMKCFHYPLIYATITRFWNRQNFCFSFS